MKKNFTIKNQQSPTWFFFNKLFDAKINKFKSFGVYKKLNLNNTYTIDSQRDYIKVKNFIKVNNCKPGLSNICNFYKKK